MQTPFFYYSKSFPEILYKNNISIVFSTYQAGKVIVVGSTNGRSLKLYAKNFARPMGIALKGDQMAVANKSKVELFSNSPSLAKYFPQKNNYYDTLFVPQVSYFTGMADIHEIEWGNDGLWAVNTAFSCLCVMDEQYSFVPKWTPPFISEILPEDRCHLNGLAMKDGKPAYVSMFDATNAKDGWRNGNTETGLLMEVEGQKVIADKLPMPHSPLLIGNMLYFLLSATGDVMVLNTTNNEMRQIVRLDNFLRGLSVYDDFLIVGASEVRQSANAFQDMPVSTKNNSSGIYILDKQTGSEIAKLTFTDLIKEIFSVKVIANASSVAMITENDELAHQFIHAPEEMDYWVKKNKKQ